MKNITLLLLLLFWNCAPGRAQAASTHQPEGGNNVAFVDGTTYPCTEAGIQSAITAVRPGSMVRAERCVDAFTWSATLTISAPLNLSLPCTTMTVTATPAIWVQASDVHIRTCGNGAAGTTGGAAVGTATQFVASGLSSGADALIKVASAKRSSFANSLISGFTLDPLYIDMHGTGNRAIEMTSCQHCKIDHPVVNNANCGNGPDGAIVQAAALSTDFAGFHGYPSSYQMDMEFPLVEISTSSNNTTCHPFFFDARYGEISEGFYNGLWANGGLSSENGADSVLIQAGTASVYESFDDGQFVNLKTQNPILGSGVYAVKMVAPGDVAAATNGRIFNVTFINSLMERIGFGPSGIGIGCTGSTSTLGSGAGCGSIIIQNPAFGGWTRPFDCPNLGYGARISSIASFGDGNASDYFCGFQYGSSTKTTVTSETLIPSGNNESLYTAYYQPAVNKNGTTGTNIFVGPVYDLGDIAPTGEGTIANAFGPFCNGYGAWARNMWCLYTTGSAGNHLESFLQIGGSNQPCPAGAKPGLSSLCYNSSTGWLSLGNNNSRGGAVLSSGNGNSPLQTRHDVPGCATDASVGATCATRVTWITPFADTNYTITSCTGNGVASGVPAIQGITSKAPNSIIVQTVALTTASAQFTSIECSAIHD